MPNISMSICYTSTFSIKNGIKLSGILDYYQLPPTCNDPLKMFERNVIEYDLPIEILQPNGDEMAHIGFNYNFTSLLSIFDSMNLSSTDIYKFNLNLVEFIINIINSRYCLSSSTLIIQSTVPVVRISLEKCFKYKHLTSNDNLSIPNIDEYVPIIFIYNENVNNELFYIDLLFILKYTVVKLLFNKQEVIVNKTTEINDIEMLSISDETIKSNDFQNSDFDIVSVDDGFPYIMNKDEIFDTESMIEDVELPNMNLPIQNITNIQINVVNKNGEYEIPLNTTSIPETSKILSDTDENDLELHQSLPEIPYNINKQDENTVITDLATQNINVNTDDIGELVIYDPTTFVDDEKTLDIKEYGDDLSISSQVNNNIDYLEVPHHNLPEVRDDIEDGLIVYEPNKELTLDIKKQVDGSIMSDLSNISKINGDVKLTNSVHNNSNNLDIKKDGESNGISFSYMDIDIESNKRKNQNIEEPNKKIKYSL